MEDPCFLPNSVLNITYILTSHRAHKRSFAIVFAAISLFISPFGCHSDSEQHILPKPMRDAPVTTSRDHKYPGSSRIPSFVIWGSVCTFVRRHSRIRSPRDVSVLLLAPLLLHLFVVLDHHVHAVIYTFQ